MSIMVAIGYAVSLPPTAAEDDIIAKLPCYGAPPASYEDCIASGIYELMGCSAKDLTAGEYHSVSVLHVPGTAQLLLHHNNALMLPTTTNLCQPLLRCNRVARVAHCWLQACYANH